MSPTSHPLSRPLRVAATALVLLALLALTACGEEKSASASAPATLVPADALAYGELLVRPGGEVGEGVRAALTRIVGVDDPGAELRRLLDEETDSGERDGYSRRIEPWLGESVAAFAIDGPAGAPAWAAIVAVSDRDEVEETLRRGVEDGDLARDGSYEGVDLWRNTDDDLTVGIVEEFVAIGTAEGLRAAVRASKGRSIADVADFQAARARVPDDRLAWGWLDGRALATLVEQSAATADPAIAANLDRLDLGDVGTAVVSLTMRADEVVVEAEGDGVDGIVRGGDGDGDGGVAVQDMPGDAWLAFAGPFAGSQLSDSLGSIDGYDRALDRVRALTGLDLERDLLSWIGGIGLFLRGTAPLDLGAGIVAGSSDAAASERFVGRLERLAGSLGLPTTPTIGDGTGFQVRLPNFPQPLVVLSRDDRVAIAIGLGTARDAVDPPQPFGEEEPGRSAIASLGDGYRAGFVLTVDPLVSLLTNLGLADDPDFRSALPYLSAYRSIAAGTKQEDGRASFKLVIGLQERDEAQGE